MNIPEGFTPRGDSNEQPPETYDKRVCLVYAGDRSGTCGHDVDRPANIVGWKIPDGSERIIAYRILP